MVFYTIYTTYKSLHILFFEIAIVTSFLHLEYIDNTGCKLFQGRLHRRT